MSRESHISTGNYHGQGITLFRSRVFTIVCALSLGVAVMVVASKFQDDPPAATAVTVTVTPAIPTLETIQEQSAATVPAGNPSISENPPAGDAGLPGGSSAEENIAVDVVTPTHEQLELQAKILEDVANPLYVQGITLDEVFQRMQALTPQQREQLVETGKRMIARGELDLNQFREPELERYPTVAEGAPLPTLEERAIFDELVGKLHDPGNKESLNYVKVVMEVQNLPPALKQEMADLLADMLEKGDLDPVAFLGPTFGDKSNIRFFIR